MKIIIISDTHDNEKRLKNLIKIVNENIKPDALIHCGDLVSPFIFKELSKVNCKVHIVFGYQDVGSLLNLVKEDKLLCQYDNMVIHDEFGEINAEDKKIFFIHNHLLAKLVAKSGEYDLVFYGHTHKAKIEKIGSCFLVNPGDLIGRKNKPSYAIYDTEKNEVELKEFQNGNI